MGGLGMIGDLDLELQRTQARPGPQLTRPSGTQPFLVRPRQHAASTVLVYPITQPIVNWVQQQELPVSH